jgi:hypothetical protein
MSGGGSGSQIGRAQAMACWQEQLTSLHVLAPGAYVLSAQGRPPARALRAICQLAGSRRMMMDLEVGVLLISAVESSGTRTFVSGK